MEPRKALSSDVYTPCVYKCHSNQWWVDNPDGVWSVQMIKFLVEHAYYQLHFNGPHRQGFSTHMRAKGLHFSGQQQPTNLLFQKYGGVERLLNLIPTTPLTDMRLLNNYAVEYPDEWTLIEGGGGVEDGGGAREAVPPGLQVQSGEEEGEKGEEGEEGEGEGGEGGEGKEEQKKKLRE